MNFEIHLTFPIEVADNVRELAARNAWHFSSIMDDPVMGPGPRCYMNAHERNALRAFETLRRMRLTAEQHGLMADRSKIEFIIYDTKTGVGVL